MVMGWGYKLLRYYDEMESVRLPHVFAPVRFAPFHLGRGICDVRFDLLILEALFSLPKNRWKGKMGRRSKMAAALP
jgi:hypothetical protein